MVEEVLKPKERKDPKHCSHPRINRVLDFWICNDCGAEFQPVNKNHKTKWSDDR
jgi:ribosomal protein L37AE/L43A